MNLKRVEKEQVKVGVQIFKEMNERINQLLEREFNIFLIGKALNDKSSMRLKLLQEFNKGSRYRKVKIYMPEFMFDELFHMKSYNLLELENMLAESVDAVVMCIESAGSFVELGAFSNHKKLSDKLIVLIDEKYKNDNSFINLGPIKHLKYHTKSEIISVDYSNQISYETMNKLYEFLSKIKKAKNKYLNYTLENPIFSERYLLTLLYVYGKVNRKTLIEIIKEINQQDKERIIPVLDATLASLLNFKEVKFDSDYYSLSQSGFGRLDTDFPPRFIYEYLDKYRIIMLNIMLRKL